MGGFVSPSDATEMTEKTVVVGHIRVMHQLLCDHLQVVHSRCGCYEDLNVFDKDNVTGDVILNN